MSGEVIAGYVRDPSMKNNLPLVDNAINIAHLHEPNPLPSKTLETSNIPG